MPTTSIKLEYERRCDDPKSDIAGHLPFLYKTVCRYDKPMVIELGVRRGNSTCAFLAAVQESDGHLWSCDAKPPKVPSSWHDLDCWTFYKGNDLLEKTLQAAPEKCEVLFIDTSHGYDETIGELIAYGPRVRPGGVILCHDTDLDSVSWALDDYGEWEDREGWHGLGVLCVS